MRKIVYREYTICRSGINYTINKPTGERLGAEIAATLETAKKWINMDINEHARRHKAQGERLT